MASPPTSEPLWGFIDEAGSPIDAPPEWVPAFIEVAVPPAAWEEVSVAVQGRQLSPQVRRLGGLGRVVVPWERASAGRYHIEVRAGERRAAVTVVVAPAKITQAELEEIVTDLETSLAPTIALSLQRMGAFAGLTINPPGETTLAAEAHRARVAALGDAATRGLVSLLPAIAADPHRMLRTDEPWVKAERARRPSPTRLAAALARPGNLGPGFAPLSLADRRVQHTCDVYENRILRLFEEKLAARLRRLELAAVKLGAGAVRDEISGLRRQLGQATARASFLGEVQLAVSGVHQVSMVLTRRPDYRAMLEAFQRYQRHVTVVVDDPALDAPFESVPSLYELWGTLQVALALVVVAERLGYRVEYNELVRHRAGDLRLVTRGARVVLRHPASGARVEFSEQPTYGTGVTGLHSISFQQVPDMAIEIRRPEAEPDLYLFDPKYKLMLVVAGEGEEELFPGGPKKVDIDKMHAYRDAIRRPDGGHAVRYAAILYPGESRSFARGIEAVRCRPGAAEALARHLQTRMTEWLG